MFSCCLKNLLYKIWSLNNYNMLNVIFINKHIFIQRSRLQPCVLFGGRYWVHTFLEWLSSPHPMGIEPLTLAGLPPCFSSWATQDHSLSRLTGEPQPPLWQSLFTRAPMMITIDSLISLLPILPLEMSWENVRNTSLQQAAVPFQ